MTSNQVNTAVREATGIQRNDFDSDLNAMHEAEKTLDKTILDLQKGSDCHEYMGHLWKICRAGAAATEHSGGCLFALATATAAQRAEAFLRTTGRWTDSAPTLPQATPEQR